MRFVAAEGTQVDAVIGGVGALFLSVTTDVPATTDGLGGFGGDEVAVGNCGVHGAVVLEGRELALGEGMTPPSADKAGGGGGVTTGAFLKGQRFVGRGGFEFERGSKFG